MTAPQPLPRAAERRRCQQCGRMILPGPNGKLRAHKGGPGDARPDGQCFGTGQPVAK